MPTLLRFTELTLEWADFANWKARPFPKTALKRSSGTHLSGIINALMISNYAENSDPPLCIAEGMAWENWVVGLPRYQPISWQPGEWECDSVFGTPDGLHKSTLYEFKRTSYSSTKWKHPLEYARWRWQVAGNLHAMGLEKVSLVVNWSRGDYRANRGCLVEYEYSFPEKETSELWNKMILPARELAKKEEHANQ